jgi:hypothetical protein
VFKQYALVHIKHCCTVLLLSATSSGTTVSTLQLFSLTVSETVVRVTAADSGPGKRWKFSLVSDGLSMYIFGGHRLWHGFATGNSADNDWNSTTQFPKGGYLNDMWVYTKRQVMCAML